MKKEKYSSIIAVMIAIVTLLTGCPQDIQPDVAGLQLSGVEVPSATEPAAWDRLGTFSEPAGPVEIESVEVGLAELTVRTYSKDIAVALPSKVDHVLDFAGSQVAMKLLGTEGLPTGQLIVVDLADGTARRFTGGSVYSARFVPDGTGLAAVLWGTHELVLIGETGVTHLADDVEPYSPLASVSALVFGQESEDESESKVAMLDLSSGELNWVQTAEELAGILGIETEKAAAGISIHEALVSERVSFDAARIQDDHLAKATGITIKAPFRAGERWLVTQGYFDDPNIADQDRSHTVGGNDKYAVDFALSGCESYGRDVLAVAPGTVTYAGGQAANGCSDHSGGYGQRVEVDHGNGLVSLYGHNSRLTVTPSSPVSYGTAISQCGNSGWACGSACATYPGTHIHFRLLQNGIPVSPEPLDGATGIVSGMWITSTNGTSFPVSPALASPADGANVPGSQVTLSWNAVSGATKYQSQVSRDAAFSSPYTGGEYSATSNSWTGFPGDGARWYWRARAGNASGWSVWSSARSFVNGTATTTLPAAPVLASPADGANVPGAQVVLTWNASPGATKYQSQVSRDAGFTSPYNGNEFGGTSNTWNGFPGDGSRWYWRARAGNGAGWSAWSAARSFVNGTGSTTAPVTPTLASPADGANVPGTQVVLTWNASPGATKYQSQVSRDAAFTSPYNGNEFSGTSNTWSGFPNDGSRWYWRARAGNTTGWSAWSSVRSFVNGTASTPLPSISSISPNPSPGSWNKTTMTIYGANFKSGATVTWRDVTHGTIYANRVPVAISSNAITIAPIFGPYAATWSAKVVNPDGKNSNEQSFVVYVAK